jgi:hypothetical protein
MAHHSMQGRVLDARPDRIDFRDKSYNQPLVSLPPCFPNPQDIATYLPEYHRTSKILDQGAEGACTGFGLAAVVNYILWDRWIRETHSDAGSQLPLSPHVSPWMLYDNARVYDEWEGEDYSGSSCRGAMKGWHKHGVCCEGLWERKTRTKLRPNPEWRSDAAQRPLGAYYRVDARSISEMQSAIHEVRAVYCSARVHRGWMLQSPHENIDFAGFSLPVIPLHMEMTGGHAFALVGYTEHGFIVQNSWGEDWGMKGFALVTYEDWVRNGDDSWVAAMAAPMHVASDTTNVPAGRASVAMQISTTSEARVSAGIADSIRPWSETRAYEHSIVMGNDGKLLRRLIDTADAADNLHKVVFELPSKAILAGKQHILLYAHGGLNSEDTAIQRAMRLGPWFEANGIHPIFLVWRTSLLESIGQIGQDIVGEFIDERAELRSRGIGDLFDRAVEKLQNKFDKAFEAAAEKLVGKAVWSQMKHNAQMAATGLGGTRQIVKAVEDLRAAHPDMSLHMLGHSAGAILLGHMLDDLKNASEVSTIGLYAPACTMGFACKHYGKALRTGVLSAGKMHVHSLSDKNERADTVGPYGKSLLYLVSRAFEEPRKTPLLGFERCWATATDDLALLKDKLGSDFAEGHIKDIRDWGQLVADYGVARTVHSRPEMVTKRADLGDLQIRTTHGSFDNALEVVNASLGRILNAPQPVVPITDLTGF